MVDLKCIRTKVLVDLEDKYKEGEFVDLYWHAESEQFFCINYDRHFFLTFPKDAQVGESLKVCPIKALSKAQYAIIKSEDPYKCIETLFNLKI